MLVVKDVFDFLQQTPTIVPATVPSLVVVRPCPALVAGKLPAVAKLALSAGLALVAPSKAEGIDRTILNTAMIVVRLLSWERYRAKRRARRCVLPDSDSARGAGGGSEGSVLGGGALVTGG